MKRVASIVLTVVLLAGSYSFGKDAPKANPYTKILASVRAAELPAEAADLVAQAKPADRKATAVQVVKEAVSLNPAAAALIVGAVTRAVPEMAPVAAGAAVAEQPKQAHAIAKAAAAAAPAQAAQVVEAVCRVAPRQYYAVAVAVAQAVPAASKEIVKAVGVAVPELKVSLEKAVAWYGGNVVSVGETLAQANQIAQTDNGASATASVADQQNSATGSLLLPRGPAVGPPYVPLSATPTYVTSGGSGEVPEGGRNYAAP